MIKISVHIAELHLVCHLYCWSLQVELSVAVGQKTMEILAVIQGSL